MDNTQYGQPTLVPDPQAKPKRKKWPWIVGGIVFLGLVASCGGGDDEEPAAQSTPAAEVTEEAPATEEVTVEETEEPEPEPELIEVPDVIGMTVKEARKELTAAGFTVKTDDPGRAEVIEQSPDGYEEVAEPGVVKLTAEIPLTLAQEQALQSAASYLDNVGGFSKESLTEQLEYEGFATKDATFAIEALDVNWKAQAAESAESYMENVGGFSRTSLYEQLEYEGFTHEQIEAGLKAVGY